MMYDDERMKSLFLDLLRYSSKLFYLFSKFVLYITGCELFMDLEALFSKDGLFFDWTEVKFVCILNKTA